MVYRAYLLDIHSDIGLKLPCGEGQRPDVYVGNRSMVVDKRKGDYRLRLVERGTPIASNKGDVITGRIYDELYFVVQRGTTVYYDLIKPLSEGALRSYLLGVLMATLLRQRGFLVLHACSVAKEGRAVAFVGESGWGKSTLAEYFRQQGYTLLSDDVLAVKVDEGDGPQVIPGYPQIRLHTEAGRHLRDDFDDLPEVDAAAGKRFITPEHFPHGPLPLHKLYLLDPGYTTENALAPIPGQGALLRLIQHTRATNLIKAPAFQAQLLRQCERVVRHVPVERLRRVRDLNRLHEIHEIVERDLTRPGGEELSSPSRVFRPA